MPRSIITFCAVLGLCSLMITGCGGKCNKSSKGKSGQVAADRMSEHYSKVSERLELGGDFYFYMNIDGDLEKLVDMIQKMVDQVRKSDKSFDMPKVNFRRILSHLGLDGILALGLSSAKDKDLYHNRAFVYLSKQRKGLLGGYGGKAHPLTLANHAPADADLVWESDAHFKTLFDILPAIMQEFPGGKKEVEQMFNELNTPIPELNLTVKDILNQANTRIELVIRIDPEKKLNIPGENIHIPFVEFMIGLDNMDVVFNPVAEKITTAPFVEKQDQAPWQMLVISPPFPEKSDFEIYKPVLAVNQKTKQLVFATSPGFLKACTASDKPLIGAKLYKQASRDLPTEGNGMFYLSPYLYKKIQPLLTEIAQQEEEFKVIKLIMDALLSDTKVATVSIRVNEKDGIFVASNEASSHKTTLLTMNYANPAVIGILAAVAIPAFIDYKNKRRAEAASYEAEREMEEIQRKVDELERNQ